ncbi:thiamine phosphate synthase [Flavobacterium ranwuense]|uniref:Thiamine phosphate synthase n=1 Tax=Flavobacterium ranwuense TaxID=2541725 RepID=A0ABY2DY53_9FLAO|nr:thiamine phosphate synthase [Flavobacterium ranwuense]TDE31877.1 thiamine phosphate synthase [Flavobacterium ranwuense]
MIIISNPISVPNEINDIHSLFAEGLMLFHVRKPDFSEAEMKAFLSEIGLEFRSQLVLHSQHHLAEEFGIKRIHFTEKMRNGVINTPARFSKPSRSSENKIFNELREKGFHLSTSVHSMEDFNTLNNVFEYAFLSPVFDSISKPNYASKTNHFEAIIQRTNFSTKLVALGGISPDNIQQTLKYGFDKAALLGTIWNSNNPIENFKICQQIAHSF